MHDAALGEYRQVLAAAPRRPGIQFRIGRVLLARANGDLSSDDAREARRAFDAELALDPTNANAAYELAEMDRKAARFEPARALFAQAVAHQPQFEHAQVGLARTLIALGRPAEALPHLKSVVERNPDNEVALYQLAQACRAVGDTQGQQHALAGFTRARTRARQPALLARTEHDVTPQALEAGAAPP
jgi:predicted Zn-dependent protease